MALGYSAMRGFGSRHGTIGELRVGEVPVRITDARGRLRSIGRIKVSEAEMLGGGRTRKKGEVPYLSLGYGLCFGQNETKAICMGMLESGLKDSHSPNPANSQEFVLYHTECIEAYGFTNHLKLPHYVDFQSGLQNLRAAIKRRQEQQERHSALRPQAHEPTGRH
jgi:alpha-D-ribose 1-methylphosphonate 5-triphosphate synthase subunit PhnI